MNNRIKQRKEYLKYGQKKKEKKEKKEKKIIKTTTKRQYKQLHGNDNFLMMK